VAQFSLLVGAKALVGGMVGRERTVLPLLAKDVFRLEAFTAAPEVRVGADRFLRAASSKMASDRQRRAAQRSLWACSQWP
jgi:hypothetical protein